MQTKVRGIPLGTLICYLAMVGMVSAMSLAVVRSAESTGLPARMTVLVLSLILTTALAIHRPVYAVYAMLIVAPFYSYLRRLYLTTDPFQGQANFDPLHALPEAVFLVAMAFAFIRRKREIGSGAGGRSLETGKPLGYFIGIAGLQVFNPMVSGLFKALNTFRLNYICILAYYLPKRLAFGESEIRRILGIALVTSTVSALYGIKQVLLGFNEGERLWLLGFPQSAGADIYRIFSTLNSAGHFADFMMVGIIIGTGVLFMRQSPVMRVLALLAVAACTAGTAVSLVRSSWFGTAAGLVFLLVVAPMQDQRARRNVMALLAVMAIVFFSRASNTGPEIQQDFTSRSYGEALEKQHEILKNPLGAPTVKGRLGQIEAALPWIARHPLGAGIGSTNVERPDAPVAENYFFTLAIETGWLGFALYVLAVWAAIKTGLGIQERLNTAEFRWLARTAVSLLVAALVTSLAGPHIAVHPLDMYVWLLAGTVPMLPSIEAGVNHQGVPGAFADGTPVSSTKVSTI